MRVLLLVGSWRVTRWGLAWIRLVLFLKCRKLVLDYWLTRLRAASAAWWNITIIGCSFDDTVSSALEDCRRSAWGDPDLSKPGTRIDVLGCPTPW